MLLFHAMRYGAGQTSSLNRYSGTDSKPNDPGNNMAYHDMTEAPELFVEHRNDYM